MSKAPVDELLAALPDTGLRLNNLFQRADGTWQANLTDGTAFYQFGLGDSPANAIVAALRVSGVNVEDDGT